MKKIEAIIRPERLEDVREALEISGYPGITLSQIEGHGMQKGTIQQWQGGRYKLQFLTKVKVEIVCVDEDEERLVRTISKAAFTGGVGDGKIFVYECSAVVRIRTQERGERALA